MQFAHLLAQAVGALGGGGSDLHLLRGDEDLTKGLGSLSCGVQSQLGVHCFLSVKSETKVLQVLAETV